MSSLPRSATNMYINTAAVLLSFLCLAWIVTRAPQLSSLQAVLLLCASYALPIAVLEYAILAPSRSGRLFVAGGAFNFSRVGIKFLGLVVTFALLFGVYWSLPEYRDPLYDRYYLMLRTLAPWFAALSLPYFLLVDRYSRQPEDGYWQMGSVVIGQWQRVDWGQLGQHLLGWLVKLFFLPLMFVWMSDKVDFLRLFNYGGISADFKSIYDFSFQFMFFIDLLIVTVGYMSTFTVTDSHIRSTEPTFLGWAVALICYPPLWPMLSNRYFAYETGHSWGSWFWDNPLLYQFWGCLILVMVAIYVWASIPFGIRFSNLTHRGILTNGPYRYCKHPAYVSKNISWWLISMPFMISVSIEESFRHCLLLLMVNFIYLMRARTEERHLSWDPDYVAYANYIERHGLLRKVGDWFPVLRFKPGRLFNT